MFLSVFDNIPLPILTLSGNFLITYCNNHFLEYLQPNCIDMDHVLERTLGEVINCRNSYLEREGCGGSEKCKHCSFMLALTKSAKSGKVTKAKKTFISKSNNTNTARYTQITIENRRTVGTTSFIVTVLDTSDEHKKRQLERTFLHDIKNSIGGAYGIADLLTEDNLPSELLEDIILVKKSTEMVLHEIDFYKMITDAKDNTLKVELSDCKIEEIIQNVILIAKGNPSIIDKEIEYEPHNKYATAYTDARIVQRIIINMLFNALEATKDNKIVIRTENNDGQLVLYIWNEGYIPENVQETMFKESCSTKSTGRGFGTYSMKLLTEEYLDGDITFHSSTTLGTTFSLRLPCNDPPCCQ